MYNFDVEIGFENDWPQSGLTRTTFFGSWNEAAMTGLEISRANLDGWVMRVGELLMLVTGAMALELVSGTYIQADETPVGVQSDRVRGKNHEAYLCQYSRPGSSAVFDFRVSGVSSSRVGFPKVHFHVSYKVWLRARAVGEAR